FHDDERMTILLPDLMDRADVGMVERGSGLRLTSEPFQSLWVCGYVLWQEFQRDESPKLGVLGLVDHTHPAAAKLLDDAVVRDGLSDHPAEILGPDAGQVNERRGFREHFDGLLAKNPHSTGAADKAVNLVGCKSPHHQLPGRVVSISDACGGNEACSART